MLDVVGRGRGVTFFRDPSWAAGRKQAIFTIHDQNFVDEYGLWLAADESLVDDGLEGFALKVDRLRHKLRVANDGKRRWYPRRNVAGEYIEFGAPQYWSGTQWKALTLGTPSRPNAQTLLWDRTNFSFELITHWRQIKLNIVLKNSGAARRVRWPVSLVGLSWQNWSLIGGDGQSVGSVVPPWGTDANGTAVPILNSYSGGYVEFTADLSGLVYP
ncbi:MAG: hypothetical protein HY548_03500, partial [Elusimicrobia bacterium]|nr:hypothetical protein [Elusimicrobiota bacterium]